MILLIVPDLGLTPALHCSVSKRKKITTSYTRDDAEMAKQILSIYPLHGVFTHFKDREEYMSMEIVCGST
jgi:hypothetical protein